MGHALRAPAYHGRNYESEKRGVWLNFEMLYKKNEIGGLSVGDSNLHIMSKDAHATSKTRTEVRLFNEGGFSNLPFVPVAGTGLSNCRTILYLFHGWFSCERRVLSLCSGHIRATEAYNIQETES
jgi:hypothetical protein